jgi:hypothetical protein
MINISTTHNPMGQENQKAASRKEQDLKFERTIEQFRTTTEWETRMNRQTEMEKKVYYLEQQIHQVKKFDDQTQDVNLLKQHIKSQTDALQETEKFIKHLKKVHIQCNIEYLMYNTESIKKSIAKRENIDPTIKISEAEKQMVTDLMERGRKKVKDNEQYLVQLKQQLAEFESSTN